MDEKGLCPVLALVLRVYHILENMQDETSFLCGY